MSKRQLILPEFFQRLIWGPLRVFMIIFCSLQVKGTENLKNLKRNVIIASNHQSELDPLLIVACLPFISRHFPIIYVTREKQFYTSDSWKRWQKILYGGTFFRMIGGYQSYVGLKNYKLALKHHLGALKLGRNVGIFPVGKRIKNKDEIVKAKGGVSFLAQKGRAPIIPVSIQGLEKLNFKGALSRKIKVTVIFGKPFYLQEIVSNPKKMTIRDRVNDYEVAASEVWKRIQSLPT